MQATSVDLCTLERCGYLVYTECPFKSVTYFTNMIGSALVSVEELDGVEGAPLLYALLRSRGEDEHPLMILVLG